MDSSEILQVPLDCALLSGHFREYEAETYNWYSVKIYIKKT